MSHNQFRSEGHRVLAYMEEHDGTIDVRVSSADCMEKLGLTIEGLEFGLKYLMRHRLIVPDSDKSGATLKLGHLVSVTRYRINPKPPRPQQKSARNSRKKSVRASQLSMSDSVPIVAGLAVDSSRSTTQSRHERVSGQSDDAGPTVEELKASLEAILQRNAALTRALRVLRAERTFQLEPGLAARVQYYILS